MQSPNPLRRKIESGQPVLGSWNIINSPTVCEILGTHGFDFQILDMEHGLFDVSSLDLCIRACEAAGSSPLVRVSRPDDHSSFQYALDNGADGIIVPQIENLESANAALHSMLFSPRGRRGYNPFTRAGLYLSPPEKTPKMEDAYPIKAMIIETQGAFRDLDRILDIPDLDVVYLGVYDMSVALGCKGQFDHPSMIDFLNTSIAMILTKGKVAGAMAKTQHEMEVLLKLGVQMIVCGVDTHLLAQAASAARGHLELAKSNVRGK